MPEANKKNKVKFGLSNVHVALLTVAEDGTITWGTPFAMPGAVNLSLSAEGEISPFYADNIVYYQSSSNSGYSGDLELALVPDEFRETILKEVKDDKGVFTENADAEMAEFALMFEFAGDKNAIRHVLYRCSCTRPNVEGATTEGTKEPTTETLSITASPLSDGRVKAKTSSDTDADTYANWYKAVYEVAAAAA